MLETIKSDPTDFKTHYQNSFIEEYTHILYPFSCLSADYCQCKRNSCQLSRIVPVSSPVLTVFYESTPINITLDSGATTSFITESLCKTQMVNLQDWAMAVPQ